MNRRLGLRHPGTSVWYLIGLALLAANLRAAITGMSPLLTQLQAVLHLSGLETSTLATLPVLCLGTFAATAPALARRFGAEATVTFALVLTAVGTVLRVAPGSGVLGLFAGTVTAGSGIAIGGALMPAVIKHHFPDRVGTLTGITMTLMACSGAAAAAAAVPLDDLAGWRTAVAVWALPALAAAVAWSPLAARSRPTGPRRALPQAREGTLRGSGLAWAVSAFLGVVSLMFYVLVAWLPQIMTQRGYTAAEAGAMVSLMLATGIPFGFLTPYLAARLDDQRPLVVVIVAVKVVGLGGILLLPGYAWVWTAVLGVATGSAFPLAMTLLSLRSPTPEVTARLSGMAQTSGYLLAGTGPLAFGVLRAATGGWAVPLTALGCLMVPEVLCGLRAARPGHVRPRLAGRGAGVGAGHPVSSLPQSDLGLLLTAESATQPTR
ncbi:MFS transporter [Kitasatospora mediocidica]|uniref:MFS transporter n=1 Tax=Kitasatospora mediocidica TaxID=58352 RepID=UPI0007C6EAF2|nr:MFS transporter [Kitasatospora mediocidica]